MSTTTVWAGDKKPVSWGVRTGPAESTPGTPVDLSGAEAVRLIAKNLNGSAHVDLVSTVAVDVVTHQLTGTLPPAHYQIVIEATDGDEVITYPDPDLEQMFLVVKPDLG